MTKMRANRNLWRLAAALCVPLVLGCGHGDRPPLGTVHGTVTLDGKPLAGAGVLFQPVEPGRASAGVTDADGRYELVYIRRDKGAKVGAHLVKITPAKRQPGQSELATPRHPAQGPLHAEVKPGDNTFDFPLSSK
jgi:hypothetical protein